MTAWIETFMTSLGYLGISFLMILETIAPPIPSEVIMPLAGFTAARGELSLVGVIVAGTLGSVLGSLLLYALGAVLGQTRLEQWLDKYGKLLGLKSNLVKRTSVWFERHGTKAVFFSRLVPGVRSLVSLPAGVVRMPLLPFLFLTTLGSGLWTTLLTLAGYVLAENYAQVDQYLGPVSYVVLAVLIVLTLPIWFRQKRA
jgi:membrane protein DedA with SNARE-associated domain